MQNNLNQNTLEVLRHVVDRYLKSGKPVGSRDIAGILEGRWSPATIRNRMADLEAVGLLISPHTSAGRMPTNSGLRLYVDEMLEVAAPDESLRKQIDSLAQTQHASIEDAFHLASEMVSGLSQYAAIVTAPKIDRIISQIQFMRLADSRTMAVIVFTDNTIDNRLIDAPLSLDPDTLTRAANYLNARLAGKTLNAMRNVILSEIRQNEAQLDTLSTHLAEQGIITQGTERNEFYVHGYANLLNEQTATEIDDLKNLIATLDSQEQMASLLSATDQGEGVRVFIGSENALFPHTGASLVTAHARTSNGRIIGSISVIGPTRMHYGRIIPIVDYTAQVMARLIERP